MILEFIAEQSGSLEVALSVQEDFAKAFRTMADNPAIGRVESDLTGPEYRWWPVHSYWAIYDPESTPL